MAPLDDSSIPASQPDPALATGSLLGKRYADPQLGLELLVTKAGAGTLCVGSQPLAMQEAKKLPSSD